MEVEIRAYTPADCPQAAALWNQIVEQGDSFPGDQPLSLPEADACLLYTSELEELQRSIHDRLKSVLGLETRVTLVEPKSLERFQGKAKRILDLRNEPDGGMGTSCIGTARP